MPPKKRARDSASEPEPSGKRSRGAARGTEGAASGVGRGRGRGRPRGRRSTDESDAPGRGRAREDNDALADGAAASASGEDETERSIVRRAQADQELQQDSAQLGNGARAIVLFHEPSFDSAMVTLNPGGCEMQETNTSELDMLYFITDGEDEKVEFHIIDSNSKQLLSRGADALVPAGAKYRIRNLSTHTVAKILAVVPQSAR